MGVLLPGLLIFFVLPFFASAKLSYERHQIWRVDARTQTEVQSLLSIIKDPATVVESVRLRSRARGEAYVWVPETREYLSSKITLSGLKYQVVVPNIQRQLNEERILNELKSKRRRVSNLDEFDYSIYHTLEQIQEWMNMMDERYSLVSKLELGLSYEGRPLHVLRIASGGQRKPVIYMDAATHAREWISPATLMYVCNQILTNTSYMYLLDELDFFFVPVVNLDGYSYTWTNDRLWRKTRSPTSSKSEDPLCVGVDANRNWDIKFGGPGSSPDPCSIFYHGPAPASEPVIRHLANFITKEKDNIKALVSLHSWGQQIMYPYNYDQDKHPPNENLLNITAANMSKAMEAETGAYYDWGRGGDILYVFSGSTSDWSYEKAGVQLSFTIELRDTGKFKFELPPDQIIPTGREVMEGIRVLSEVVIKNHSKVNPL